MRKWGNFREISFRENFRFYENFHEISLFSYVFVWFFSRKAKINFRENTKTKIFVSTQCILYRNLFSLKTALLSRIILMQLPDLPLWLINCKIPKSIHIDAASAIRIMWFGNTASVPVIFMPVFF
jgi:hypothetical protein